jgi:predicted DNA-binding transcriptional regulator AlpA
MASTSLPLPLRSPDFSDEDFIDLDQVKRITGLGRSAIYERAASDLFPKPVALPLTPGSKRSSVRWIRGEVRAWKAAAVAERDQATAAARAQGIEPRPIRSRKKLSAEADAAPGAAVSSEVRSKNGEKKNEPSSSDKREAAAAP